MAHKNELLVVISREGEVSLEVDGVTGPSCLDVTKDIEESLGRVTAREKKAAFHAGAREEELSLSRGGAQ
ncbi:MAG: DUF2997 domain-containing protein [Spirochaetaceae bacterium]|nr:DUF2997 domain-containing protein [Spirochaetaceae bacterium]